MFHDNPTLFCSNFINLMKTYGHVTSQMVKKDVKNNEIMTCAIVFMI